MPDAHQAGERGLLLDMGTAKAQCQINTRHKFFVTREAAHMNTPRLATQPRQTPRQLRSMVSESDKESPESTRRKCLAFCMAAHRRLGRQTLPFVLDESLMQMIAQPIIKGAVAREAFVEHLRIPSLRHRPGAEIIGNMLLDADAMRACMVSKQDARYVLDLTKSDLADFDCQQAGCKVRA